jgi:Ca2+-binding EF-hand superfamily protein
MITHRSEKKEEKFLYSYRNLMSLIRGKCFQKTKREDKQKIFDECLDIHQGGTIDPIEFGALMTKYGHAMTVADAEDFFSHIYDGSGALDYDEFIAHLWVSDGATARVIADPTKQDFYKKLTPEHQLTTLRQATPTPVPRPPRQPQSSQGVKWGARRVVTPQLHPLDVRSPQPSDDVEQQQQRIGVLSPLKQAQVKDSLQRRAMRDRLEADLRQRMGGNNWQNLLQILRRADTNKSGDFDRKEFRSVLREFGMQVCCEGSVLTIDNLRLSCLCVCGEQAKPAEAKELFNAHRDRKTDRVDYRDFLKYFLLERKGGGASAAPVGLMVRGRPGTVGAVKSSRVLATRLKPAVVPSSFYSQRVGTPNTPSTPARTTNVPAHTMRKGFLARPVTVDTNQQSSPSRKKTDRSSVIPAGIKNQVAVQWKSIRRACQAIDAGRNKQIAARDFFAVLKAFNVEATAEDIMLLPGRGATGPMRIIQYNEIIKVCLQAQ